MANMIVTTVWSLVSFTAGRKEQSQWKEFIISGLADEFPLT